MKTGGSRATPLRNSTLKERRLKTAEGTEKYGSVEHSLFVFFLIRELFMCLLPEAKVKVNGRGGEKGHEKHD